MKLQTHRCVWMAILALVVALVPAMARADVTKIQISSRQDVLAGKAFGNVGPYEKLRGKVYSAVDPKDSRHNIIAAPEQAPKNSQRKVEYSADLFILKPKDSSKGN